MAGMYKKAEEAFLKGQIDLTSVTVKAVAVDTALYTVNLTTHEFLSDIAAGARVGISGALGGKTVTSGVFTADNALFTALSGASVEAVVVFVDTGSAATSRLISYHDSGTGIPYTPGGGDYTHRWNNNTGSSGIIFQRT
jgi:hypothetical protein